MISGEGAARRVAVGGLAHAAPPGPGGPVTVSVRPERIALAGSGEPGLAGRIEARIFQGNHWLYQIGTEAGRVTVIRPNDGLSAPAEGADVVLAWRAEDAAIRQRAGA